MCNFDDNTTDHFLEEYKTIFDKKISETVKVTEVELDSSNDPDDIREVKSILKGTSPSNL